MGSQFTARARLARAKFSCYLRNFTHPSCGKVITGENMKISLSAPLLAAFFVWGQAQAVCDAPYTASKWGLASQFNLFVEKDLEHVTTQVEGRVAVGGNAKFRNYSVGQRINDNTVPYALVVGGDLDFVHGSIWNGHASVGGRILAFSHYNVYFNHTLYSGRPLDFAAEFARVKNSSARAAGIKATGTVEYKEKGVVLSSTDAASAVFFLDGNELSKATFLQLDASREASVVINVSGKSVALKDFGFRISGAVPENTLFNFYDAEKLTLAGIGVVGSVLAPNADLDFSSANIQGNVIVKSLKGTGFVRLPAYRGCLP